MAKPAVSMEAMLVSVTVVAKSIIDDGGRVVWRNDALQARVPAKKLLSGTVQVVGFQP